MRNRINWNLFASELAVCMECGIADSNAKYRTHSVSIELSRKTPLTFIKVSHEMTGFERIHFVQCETVLLFLTSNSICSFIFLIVSYELNNLH